MKKTLQPNPIFPVAIVVDTREQLRYGFAGIPFDAIGNPEDAAELAEAEARGEPYQFVNVPADKTEGGGAWVVETTTATLRQGDYSLLGFESRIAIERKSLPDLYGSLGAGRDRFERELERLCDESYMVTEVVVEAELSEIVGCPPYHSKLSPKTINRTLISWRQKYRKVHWNLMPNREWAEVQTFRILHKFWKDATAKKREMKT